MQKISIASPLLIARLRGGNADDDDAETVTYTVYDSDPSSPGAVPWPSHTDIPVDVDPHDDVCQSVVELLEELCSTLRPEDGYAAGQIIWAHIRMPDGSTDTVSVELTAEHLET